jgi:hypothetical protein
MTPKSKTTEPLLQAGRLQRAVEQWRKLKKIGEDSIKEASKERDVLKGFVQRQGHRDADGHFWVELDEMIQLPGTKPFNAIKNERHVSDQVDEDVAETILTKLGLYDEVFDMVPVLNQDKFEKLYREGRISRRDYNRIVTQVETFNFVMAKVE